MKKVKRPKELTFKDVIEKLQSDGYMPKNSQGHSVTIRAEVNPIELKPYENKLNWKSHPERQRKFLTDTIDDDGWVTIPVFCANNMKLLDGHGRLQTAIDNGWKSIPIDIGYWSKEQAEKLSISIDTSQRMSSVDGNALKSLSEKALSFLDEKKKDLEKSVQVDMLKDVYSYSEKLTKKKLPSITVNKTKKSLDSILKKKSKQKPRDQRERTSDNETMYDSYLRSDVHFPSEGNVLGIPDLLPSKLYTDQSRLPVDTFDRTLKSLHSDNYYCQSSRRFDFAGKLKPIGGFLGFYCEDKNFTNMYVDPVSWWVKLEEEQWDCIVEPDYSTFWDWPLAKRIWAVYRSRWLCRYWQELGQKVMPILRRTNDLERDKWLYDSLPETPIAFMQLRMGGKKNQSDPEYWNGVGEVLEYCYEKLKLQTVLFYGGESLEKYVVGKIPTGLNYKMVIPYITKRMTKKKKGS